MALPQEERQEMGLQTELGREQLALAPPYLNQIQLVQEGLLPLEAFAPEVKVVCPLHQALNRLHQVGLMPFYGVVMRCILRCSRRKSRNFAYKLGYSGEFLGVFINWLYASEI